MFIAPNSITVTYLLYLLQHPQEHTAAPISYSIKRIWKTILHFFFNTQLASGGDKQQAVWFCGRMKSGVRVDPCVYTELTPQPMNTRLIREHG